jgi:hypothetical protein
MTTPLVSYVRKQFGRITSYGMLAELEQPVEPPLTIELALALFPMAVVV